MVAIRLEDIPRFKNRTFSKDRILLSKVGNLDESEINKRLQSTQALSPYDKHFGKINSATVQAIGFIRGAYNPSTVLSKLLSDRNNPQVQTDYKKILKDIDYFNSYDEIIIAFAKEHNDTVMTSDKGLQNVLDQNLYNEAISIKPSDSVTSSFVQTGQAQARARQDTERSKIAQKEEQPLQLVQEAFAEEVEIKLSNGFYQVLKQIKDGNIIIPSWFQNNIRWVQNGQITEKEFFDSYNNLINAGVITTKEIEIEKPLPVEPQVNDIVNFPMVKQTAIDFQIEGSRITGSVILDKISANWNDYYDGRNLVSYFQTSDLADITLVNKPNIVKFRPTEPPLLPTEKITINESTEGKDKIKVKLFLLTEDNIPVAEPLEFLLQEGEIIIAKPKPRRTDFLGTIGAGIAGAIGISLLLSGVKNKS